MYALEPEPEQKGRWRRLGGGALIAVSLSAGMVYGADQFEPTRRILEKVVKLTVTVEAPKPPPPEKLPPLPPPPKRPTPKQKTLAPKQKVQEAKPQTNEPQQVGLDDASFGEGTGGPAFAAGNTAMGTPPTTVAPPVVKKPEPPPAHPAVYREAKPVRPIPPQYTERARRLGIQGLLVLEVDVDDRGRVTGVRLRRGLEPGLDQHAVRTVKQMAFQPATRGGRSVASTRFLRIKYQLEG